MANYKALVEVQLTAPNAQAQLSEMFKNKKVTIQAEIKNAEKLRTTLGNITNQLERIQIKNKDAFGNSQAVKDQLAIVTRLKEQFALTGKGLGDYRVAYGRLSNEVAKYNEASRVTVQSTDNFSTAMGKAVEKIALWGVATSIIYGSLRQLKEGTQYVKDLNEAMTNIGLVTGQTTKELQGTAGQFNEMARELGSTTLEMAEGATTWIRQGKSAAETMELLRVSTMLAKLGDLEAAEATAKLTSVLNGYRLETEDAIKVTDTLIALDNSLATSTKEIADGMEKSSSMANAAGVSYQNLATYIGVIQAVTQQTGDTVGQAVKTMFARFQQVKAGAKIFESDGEVEDINNVEKALRAQNIEIRDSAGSFRELDAVLPEVAAKYQELMASGQDVAAKQIIGAIAGVRQINMLETLMQNWDLVKDSQSEVADNMGLTTSRYDIYMKSLEAASNNLRASWEKMWSASLPDETIAGLLNAVSKLLDSISGSGGLVPVVTTLLGLFAAWKNLAIGVNVATGAISLAFESMLGPIGLAITAISLLVIGFNNLKTASEKVDVAVSTLSDINAQIEDLKSKEGTISDLSEEYLKLKNSVRETREEQERYNEVQNDLKDILPSIAGFYNDEGNFVISDNALSTNQAYLDLLEGIVLKRKELASLAAVEAIKSAVGGYKTETGNISQFSKEANKDPFAPIGADLTDLFAPDYAELQSKIDESVLAQDEFVQAIVDSWGSLSEEAQEEQKKYLSLQGEVGERALELIEGLNDSAPDLEDNLSGIGDSADGAYRSFGSLTKEVDALAQAQEEQAKNGYISNKTALDLVDANANLAQYLTKTANGYYLNVSAAKAALLAEIQTVAAHAKLGQVAIEAAKGNYILAKSLIAVSTASKEDKESMNSLLASLASLATVSFGGGGGGKTAAEKASEAAKKAYEAEIDAIEDKIDAYEKQKDALKDTLEAYKEIIDAAKEKLRLEKEENEYLDDVKDKNEEIADIDNQLYALQFDQSQEANKKRLELEEERVKAVEELAEIQADRTYDIQIEALDNEYEAFEKMIDAQIDGIDRMITKFEEMIDAIRDAIEALEDLAEAGYGSGYSSSVVPTTKTVRPKTVTVQGKTGGRTSVTAAASGGAGTVPEGFPNDSYNLNLTSGEKFMVFNKQQQRMLGNGFFVSGMNSPVTTAQSSSSGNGFTMGDINIDVAGNLDGLTLNKVRSLIGETLNDFNKQRGMQTNAFRFST